MTECYNIQPQAFCPSLSSNLSAVHSFVPFLSSSSRLSLFFLMRGEQKMSQGGF